MIRNLVGQALLSVALAAFSLQAQAQAETVTVGLSADVTSVDPHYQLLSPNQNISDHIFNRLVERNEQLRMLPGLALSWKTVDPTTWEFQLRPNVTFHDGSPFTAEDVVFSIERIASIKDSPAPFTVYTKFITGMSIVDPMTVRFKTATPYPLLPNYLSAVYIVSKKAAAQATTADFNSGKAAVGTGPYKLVRFNRGDRVELVRNDAYWGKKPVVQNVTFKIMTNDSARVAALLSKDVQAIEAVPVADLKRLNATADINVIQRIASRFIFLNVDSKRDQTPFVTDKDGKPLAHNPLKDVRVRKALSKAIDRNLIASKVMEGASRPTGQLMIPGLPGYNEALKVEPVDVEGAKKLLAEAGYPNGFNLTLHGPNNRYVQDDQILQALAQMFGRVGITTKVEAMPATTFMPRQNKGEYSVSLAGWAGSSYEASGYLRPLLETRDVDKGMGTFNGGRYSNPSLDELIDKAVETLDDAEREKLLQKATEMAMADQAIIPLHHQVNLWAARKPLIFPGRSDERTYGFSFVNKEP